MESTRKLSSNSETTMKNPSLESKKKNECLSSSFNGSSTSSDYRRVVVLKSIKQIYQKNDQYSPDSPRKGNVNFSLVQTIKT